jgi:hypothetical protein
MGKSPTQRHQQGGSSVGSWGLVPQRMLGDGVGCILELSGLQWGEAAKG